jgi:hypothetical protein
MVTRGCRAAMTVVLALTTAGCDPCSGISACVGAPRLSVEGWIVERATGRSIPGARVAVIRRGGVDLEPDSADATTDAVGHFEIALGARKPGAVVFDVLVLPPVGRPYRVRGLRTTATEIRGDAYVLGLWANSSYFAYVGELYYRANPGTRVGGARVEFRRTGGVELYGPGWVGAKYETVSDAAGRFQLFDQHVLPVDAGEVVGDLTIYPPSEAPPTVIPDLRLPSTPAFRPTTGVIVLGVGPDS